MRIVEVKHLYKKYGKEPALEDVSFTVEQGQVLGVVGPNGSGKTTMFGIMLGLRAADAGQVEIFGESDVQKVKHRMGIAMDQGSFYHGFSAQRNLMLSAIAKGVSPVKIKEVLALVELDRTGNKAYKNFSYGMKKRLEIADALIHEPDLYILDEPTNGLDPEGIVFIRELIAELSMQGKTIIVSSHYLQEIERVCTHILMLRRGQVQHFGEKEELKTLHGNLEDLFIRKKS